MDRQRGWMPLAAVATTHVLLFAYYLRETMIRQPYWDMYSQVVRYLQFRRDGGWWAYLWEPHVQHRQVWMRLLTALDAEVFAGVSYPFIGFSTACHLATAWMVWRVVRSASGGAGGVVPACLAVMLTLTSVAAVDCAIPITGVYPQALAFTVGALVLFDAGDSSGASRWRRLAAMASAMAAAFANAAALAVWPILVWLAWRTRAGRAWTAAVAGTGLLFGAVYVYRLPIAALGDSGVSAVSGPEIARAATYLFTYLGLPWTRAASLEAIGRAMGAGLFAASVAAVLWYGLLRPADRLQRFAVALIGFSLATAILAAGGRADVEAEVLVPVRYAVFVAPMHVGLLLLAWPLVFGRRAWAVGPARLEHAAALALGLLLLAQQVASGEVAAATTRSMRSTLDRFAAGEESDEMKTVVFVNLEQARRDLDAIRGAGLYLNAR